jgi:hypothetical protein
MKKYGGVDLGTSWEWSGSYLGHLIPEERAIRYPLDRRLDGPQALSR